MHRTYKTNIDTAIDLRSAAATAAITALAMSSKINTSAASAPGPLGPNGRDTARKSQANGTKSVTNFLLNDGYEES